jgi:ribosomal protein S18 acetylase RimI-like enzyme
MGFRLVSPATEADWRQVDLLVDELKAWDFQQCSALGFSPEEILKVFYPSDSATIKRDSVLPNGALIVALDDSQGVGSAAFHRMTAEACELYNVYVRPSHQGRRIASTMLRQLMRDAKTAGYQSMCLETASFMQPAQRLYQANGFKVREPYRTLDARFHQVTIWMEARLDSQ